VAQGQGDGLPARRRYEEAFVTLDLLRAEKGESADVRKQPAVGPADGGPARRGGRARGAAPGGRAVGGEAALHTAAMVLLERGMAGEAAAQGSRRQQRMSEESDDAQRIYRRGCCRCWGSRSSPGGVRQARRLRSELLELRRRYLAPAGPPARPAPPRR
jgi:hypothetical protein